MIEPGERSPQDPRLTEYAKSYLKRLQEAAASVNPNSFISLSRELASEKLKLEEATDRDPLTGLLNRRGFEREFARALERRRRKLSENKETKLQSAGSLLMIDLDRFKKTNDTKGHSFGDLVLKKVAETIQNAVRPDDIVGRFGGEELVILLDDCQPKDAVGPAERIRLGVSAETTEQLGYTQTISIGISGIEPVGLNQIESPDFVVGLFGRGLLSADQALYHAKNTGRNGTAFFGPDGKLISIKSKPNDPSRKLITKQS